MDMDIWDRLHILWEIGHCIGSLIPIFQDFLLLLKKNKFGGGGDWALGFSSLEFWDFADVS